jgi:hypothetical protein
MRADKNFHATITEYRSRKDNENTVNMNIGHLYTSGSRVTPNVEPSTGGGFKQNRPVRKTTENAKRGPNSRMSATTTPVASSDLRPSLMLSVIARMGYYWDANAPAVQLSSGNCNTVH